MSGIMGFIFRCSICLIVRYDEHFRRVFVLARLIEKV